MPDPADITSRRRKALYRANHRGTREMDVIFGRFAVSHLPTCGDPELGLFERLLEQPDPDLVQWVTMGTPAGEPEFEPLISAMRRFHGLAV